MTRPVLPLRSQSQVTGVLTNKARTPLSPHGCELRTLHVQLASLQYLQQGPKSLAVTSVIRFFFSNTIRVQFPRADKWFHRMTLEANATHVSAHGRSHDYFLVTVVRLYCHCREVTGLVRLLTVVCDQHQHLHHHHHQVHHHISRTLY